MRQVNQLVGCIGNDILILNLDHEGNFGSHRRRFDDKQKESTI